MKNIPKINNFKIHSGKNAFTLVELLIAIFILSIVIIITSSALSMGAITGNNMAVNSKKVNRDLQFIADTVRLNMQNANASKLVGATQVNGFYVINNPTNVILITVNNNQPKITCSFVAWDSVNSAVYETQNDCKVIPPVDLTNFQRLSSTDVKITNFVLSHINVLGSPSDTNLDLTINGEDNKGENRFELKDTYALGYEAYKGL